MWKILKDFKEIMCPSTEIRDMREKLRQGFNESLRVKELEIQDLKDQIEELKKKHECCFCKSTENLIPFTKKLWDLRGYPSYYYCNKVKCIHNYLIQLETML